MVENVTESVADAPQDLAGLEEEIVAGERIAFIRSNVVGDTFCVVSEDILPSLQTDALGHYRGHVVYTCEELRFLAAQHPTPETLRLLHHSKKLLGGWLDVRQPVESADLRLHPVATPAPLDPARAQALVAPYMGLYQQAVARTLPTEPLTLKPGTTIVDPNLKVQACVDGITAIVEGAYQGARWHAYIQDHLEALSQIQAWQQAHT